MSDTTLDGTEVRRIAALAHLALTEDEVEVFTRQLGGILDYVQRVQAEPTEGVTPMSHVATDDAHERADERRWTLPKQAALGNAPEAAREAGYFKVPKVIG